TPLGEPLHPELLLEPPGERPARDTRRGHLEDTDVAHLPSLADERSVDIEPCGGQVLAEDAVGQWPPELSLPEVQVLAGIGIDGLVGPSMRARVADGVASGTAPPRFRPRVAQRNRFWRWPFVDPTHTRGGLLARGHAADVDGKERRHQDARIAATHQDPFALLLARNGLICSERCEFCSERNRGGHPARVGRNPARPSRRPGAETERDRE